MALAVDPRIESLLAAARGTVSAGNAQRNQLALMAALGLTDAGLFERANAQIQGRAGAGFAEAPELENLTYGITRGPEGRLYRDARMGHNAAAAAAGIRGGSGLMAQQLQSRRMLDQQANAQLRAFDAQQSDTLMGQTQNLSGLGQNIAEIRFEQAREAAAAKAAADQAAADAAAAGGGGATGARPGWGANWLWAGAANPGQRGLQTLDKRFGEGQYRIVRRGPKAPANQRFVAVRR